MLEASADHDSTNKPFFSISRHNTIEQTFQKYFQISPSFQALVKRSKTKQNEQKMQERNYYCFETNIFTREACLLHV